MSFVFYTSFVFYPHFKSVFPAFGVRSKRRLVKTLATNSLSTSSSRSSRLARADMSTLIAPADAIAAAARTSAASAERHRVLSSPGVDKCRR